MRFSRDSDRFPHLQLITFLLTFSMPRCVTAGSPAPSSHLETTRRGTAAPLPGSIAPRAPPPSSPRTSSGTRESSSPARARPLPAPSAGRRATLPALPVHAVRAFQHIPPRSGKTTGPPRREAAFSAPQGLFETPPPASGCCPFRQTLPRTVRRASAPALLPQSLPPPPESSGAPR